MFSNDVFSKGLMQTSLTALNRSAKVDFVERLGGVFEHSPWVAEAAAAGRPFASLEALHRAMVEAVARAPEEKKLALIRAHPDLAGRAALAGELTGASRREQAGAGLDRLSPEEYARFHRLNDSYRQKFGFPFILAVKGHSKESVLAAFEARLPHERAEEIDTALAQIYQIARVRLEAIVQD